MYSLKSVPQTETKSKLSIPTLESVVEFTLDSGTRSWWGTSTWVQGLDVSDTLSYLQTTKIDSSKSHEKITRYLLVMSKTFTLHRYCFVFYTYFLNLWMKYFPLYTYYPYIFPHVISRLFTYNFRVTLR